MPRLSREERIADEESSRQGLSFSVGTKVFVGIYFAALLTLTFAQERGQGSAHALGSLTGALIASVLMLAIPTFISWLLFKSKRATNGTCVVVVCLLFLVMLSSAIVDAGSRGAVVQARDVATRVSQTTKKRIEKQIAASEAYDNAGGYDPVSIRGDTDLDDRIAMLDELIVLTKEVRQEYANQESRIREGFKPLLLSSEDAEEIIAEWKMLAQPALVDRINELEVRVYQEQKAFLLFLESSDWIIDPREGRVVFQDEQSVDTFKQFMDSINADAAAFEALQKELLDRYGQIDN